jgi:hypothetical protein
MGLVISKGLTLRKGWQPMDPDAAAYITAVETADGQALEEKTKIAIDNFVLGCKQDGIWSAIKASCILAGARTRLGALTPLVGTAPTSFNFVDGDYNRKTGLVGDGSTKYLDSNRNNDADPQNSNHNVTWLSHYTSGDQYLIGINEPASTSGTNFLLARTNAVFIRNRLSTGTETGAAVGSQFSGGLFGASRASGSSVSIRYRQDSGMISGTRSTTSASPSSGDVLVYRSGASTYSNCRLAFYSIGESLDLALLDARVTDLINAFGAAIP